MEKPVEIIKEIEVPVRKTITREIEKPIYVDKVVKRPVVKVVDKPYYVDKTVEVPIDRVVEMEIM